jgi:hypothetical protein
MIVAKAVRTELSVQVLLSVPKEVIRSTEMHTFGAKGVA